LEKSKPGILNVRALEALLYFIDGVESVEERRLIRADELIYLSEVMVVAIIELVVYGPRMKS
jgi:hypothetical protein